MAEVYVGTKFKTIFAGRNPPDDARLDEIVRWCRRFAELGLASGGSGNMSFRTESGFVVSRTAGNLALIKADEFVEVIKTDIPARELTVIGAHEPSSESMMHAAIYQARPEINAIFHGHHDRILAEGVKLGIPVTEREQPYGTPEFVAEILKILGRTHFFLMRNHGFTALGGNMDEAGRNTEDILARVLNRS